MKCTQLELALASDDPAEQTAARRHAADCLGCAAVLAAEGDLDRQIAAWKAAPVPPPELERRIAAAITDQAAAGPRLPAADPRRRFTRQRWWRLAAAALVLLGLGLPGYLLFVPQGDPVARAVRELDRIQHRHAEAIAVLERQAATVLDRAGDPDLPAVQVAHLLGVRDRLTHLDAVIADVRGFLSEQPGHAGANKVLLAAYVEKDELLRTILNTDLGGLS